MKTKKLDKYLNQIILDDNKNILKEIPDGSVDLIISSPPYNIGKAYEKRTALDNYLHEQSLVLRECARILKPTGSIFWQVGSYSSKGILIPLDVKLFPILEGLGLFPRNRIIWVRQHGLHAQKKFSARHESILWFTKSDEYKFYLDNIRVPQKYQNKRGYRGNNKGELTCNPEGKNPGDIWLFRNVKHNHEERTIHPCQFPEDMIARIILATTDIDDVVFDPYMGTGTVAVVAKANDRYYIGAENDKDYVDISTRRLLGEPDNNNSFPNLKSLRAYVQKTGKDITKYRFDVQVGDKPSDNSKAKIFSEEHHREELFQRLEFEESTFSAKLTGSELPDDEGFVKKPKND